MNKSQLKYRWECTFTGILYLPFFCDIGVVNVVVERAVRHGLNKVDAERVPERTKWISAFSVATPVLNVALIKYCIKSRFHEYSFYQVSHFRAHSTVLFSDYELLSSEIILKYFFVLKLQALFMSMFTCLLA